MLMNASSSLIARLPALAVTAALAMAAPAFAQMDHDHGAGHMQAAKANPDAAPAEGTIKKVDKAAGRITIAHGPLENIGMPPMTMAFRTADPAMLEQVAPGDKIRFTANRVKGVFIVETLEVMH